MNALPPTLPRDKILTRDQRDHADTVLDATLGLLECWQKLAEDKHSPTSQETATRMFFLGELVREKIEVVRKDLNECKIDLE